MNGPIALLGFTLKRVRRHGVSGSVAVFELDADACRWLAYLVGHGDGFTTDLLAAAEALDVANDPHEEC